MRKVARKARKARKRSRRESEQANFQAPPFEYSDKTMYSYEGRIQ